MSTHWGFVCESHDPPLISETWLNHGDDALIDAFRKERVGEWPTCTADDYLAWEGEPYYLLQEGDTATPVPPHSGGGAPPWSGIIPWLREHPRCKVALRNEYGDRREIGETVQGEVAPPAVEA